MKRRQIKTQNIYHPNYTIHKIKDIKGPKQLTQKDFEIIEDLNKIHEIKEIKNLKNNGYKNKKNYQKGFGQKYQKLRESSAKKNYNKIFEIKYEGDPSSKYQKKLIIENSMVNLYQSNNNNYNTSQELYAGETFNNQQNYNYKKINVNIYPVGENNGQNQFLCNECQQLEQNKNLCNECKAEDNLQNQNQNLCNECQVEEQQQNNNGSQNLCNEYQVENQQQTNKEILYDNKQEDYNNAINVNEEMNEFDPNDVY